MSFNQEDENHKPVTLPYSPKIKAKNDCAACEKSKVLDLLVPELKILLEKIEEIEKLIKELNENRYSIIERMPFGKHQGTPLKDLPKAYVQWLSSTGTLEKKELLNLKLNLEMLGFI